MKACEDIFQWDCGVSRRRRRLKLTVPLIEFTGLNVAVKIWAEINNFTRMWLSKSISCFPTNLAIERVSCKFTLSIIWLRVTTQRKVIDFWRFLRLHYFPKWQFSPLPLLTQYLTFPCCICICTDEYPSGGYIYYVLFGCVGLSRGL